MPGKPKGAIDLIFLVDSSAGVQWNRMKSYTKSLLNYFRISPEGTHVGYAVYANRGGLKFSFPQTTGTQYRYNADMVRRSIDGVGREGGNQRNIRLGLSMAAQAFSQPKFGARANARKV